MAEVSQKLLEEYIEAKQKIERLKKSTSLLKSLTEWVSAFEREIGLVMIADVEWYQADEAYKKTLRADYEAGLIDNGFTEDGKNWKTWKNEG